WDAHADDGDARVGVAEYEAVMLHGVVRQTAVQFDADADAPLVQVRPAVGRFRWQPQHRHRRLLTIDDHTHVRDALVGDGLEIRVQADALRENRLVRPTAERVHA